MNKLNYFLILFLSLFVLVSVVVKPKSFENYFKLDIDDDYVPESFWYSDMLTKEQVVEGWDYFIKSNAFERLKPIVDPENFNAKFGAYPVHFITNIPPDCLERRVKNLRNAGFKFKSVHCGGFINYEGKTSKKKAEVIKELLQGDESPSTNADNSGVLPYICPHFS